MKRITVLIVVLLILSHVLSKAQEKPLQECILKGRIIHNLDSTGINANVLIFSNGSLVAGTVANENGHYEIKGLKKQQYTLRAKHLFADEDSVFIVSFDSTNEVVLNIGMGGVIPNNKLLFNAEKAKRDIENGIVRILVPGLPVERTGKPNDLLTKKYGFWYEQVGDYITNNLRQSMEKYNSVVYSYLVKRNGKGWKTKFQADSLKLTQKN